MLRLLKYLLSERAASPLECLTDNSGGENRGIYSNLCLDRKNGYQHAVSIWMPTPRGTGQAGLSTCTSGALPSGTLFFAPCCFPRLSPEEFGILSFSMFSSKFSFSLALKIK